MYLKKIEKEGSDYWVALRYNKLPSQLSFLISKKGNEANSLNLAESLHAFEFQDATKFQFARSGAKLTFVAHGENAHYTLVTTNLKKFVEAVEVVTGGYSPTEKIWCTGESFSILAKDLYKSEPPLAIGFISGISEYLRTHFTEAQRSAIFGYSAGELLQAHAIMQNALAQLSEAAQRFKPPSKVDFESDFQGQVGISDFVI